MNIKRLCYILMILSICTTNIFASSQTSDSYTLILPHTIPAGGSTSSSNYSIDNTSIGKPFGGISESPNFTLNTAKLDPEDCLTPPVLNPIISPTNVSVQTLSGTKQKGASIYINGYEAVPMSDEINWTYNMNLDEGDNHYIITARDGSGLESDPVYATITLDTIPPIIIINDQFDGVLVYTSQISIEGTIDGVPFTQEENLNFGVNQVTVEASDGAGNTSFENMEVYFIREPLAAPSQ